MKLTQKQLRQIIEGVVTEADEFGGQLDALMQRQVAAIIQAFEEVARAYQRADGVVAMARYNKASRHVKNVLEILEGHPENVE
jgi:hypothetical protein